MAQDGTPQAVQATHEFLRWLILLLDKFSRQRRFTLGERMEHEALTVLALLAEAAYARDKDSLLQHTNVRIEVLRHLWRLASQPVGFEQIALVG